MRVDRDKYSIFDGKVTVYINAEDIDITTEYLEKLD